MDDRAGYGVIRSRPGLHAAALMFESDDDLLALSPAEDAREPVACVLIDEAQFRAATGFGHPR